MKSWVVGVVLPNDKVAEISSEIISLPEGDSKLTK